MKKLMIAAAVAAMIGGAQAVTSVTTKGHWEKDDCGEKTWVCGDEGCGTAHKVVITLKTTAAKNTKATCNECNIYRVQATKKINGLIWEKLTECGCTVPFGANVAFWTKDEAIPANLTVYLSKIGKATNSKSIEAVGTISDDDQLNLTWAGFGTLAGKAGKEGLCGDTGTECVEYVKSITGGIAGTLPAPGAKCADTCVPMEYDYCCDDVDKYCADMAEFYTAAYGTIKITYDTATAKKVAVAEDETDINSFYKLPASVKDDVEAGEVVIEE